MGAKFYVTTPIYYVNDVPHIGHAYTTIAADVLARFHRLGGREVFFLTGTDEHGQKVEKAAAERGRSPKEHADSMVQNYKGLWEKLDISYDAFIRTTDDEHIRTVQGILQRLLEKGEIVKKSYSGWYCTPDERFWTEKDLLDGQCPDCNRPVERIHEENYFFLMSRYQQDLITYIEEHPDFILPETRRNEVLGFLRSNELGDLCISRPKERLAWGIPLPFDENFVTYVWFDALLNYFSATRYLAPGADRAKQGDFWWPATHHLIGKDILTTHAVYWSTMLLALGFPLPENIFAHGWWTVEGKKMSKSLGNVVDPQTMAEKYSVDAFRYFLLREVPFGHDGDFSEDAFINRINTDLANDLGNLLSRFLAMADKYRGGRISIPEEGSLDEPGRELKAISDVAVRSAMDSGLWDHLRFNHILEHVWELIRGANNHIAKTEPWKLAKGDQQALDLVLFGVWNGLRLAAALLSPFMPGTADRMWEHLGLRSLRVEAAESMSGSEGAPALFAWGWSPRYDVQVLRGSQLFPRIEKTSAEPAPLPSRQDAGDHTSGQQLLSIEDFAKVELRIGKVLSAEMVKKSSKLVCLTVDTGERRQIVAGIGKVYKPEDLVGRKIAVVTNLKPAKLMGVESQGMLLAATDPDGNPVLLTPETDVPEGSKIR